MLFGIAVMLATSVTLSGVAGVVGAPQNAVPDSPAITVSSTIVAGGSAVADGPARQGAVDPAAPRLAGALGPPVSPARAVDAALLPRLGGRALLEQLTLLSPRDIAAFVEAHPAAVGRLLANPPSAKTVAGWWALTSDPARESFLDGAPELAGNLDGLPMRLRDEANRVVLRDSIAEAEAEISELGRAHQVDAAQRLHMLGEVRTSLVTRAGQPPRHLLQLDTVWPGKAAVVIGDLESADFVSYFVPGMFFSTDRLIVEWSVIAEDLYEEQTDWIKHLARDDASLRGTRVATVAWIGYQTPGILDIASLDLAREGATSISSAVQGVQATRAGEEPFLTLLTHSYGSTATLMAIESGRVEVDSLVLIGSPGSAAQSVDELNMPSDRVFVGEAAWDPVVNSAFFGSDPGADSFGAQTMRVAGGIDPITGRTLEAATGHLGYFDIGTESMRNMSLVGLGQGHLVTGSESAKRGTVVAVDR